MAAGDVAAALRHARIAWRINPAPAIGVAVQRASDLALQRWAPPSIAGPSPQAAASESSSEAGLSDAFSSWRRTEQARRDALERFHQTWLALARSKPDPVAVGWLVARLLSKLPEASREFDLGLNEGDALEQWATQQDPNAKQSSFLNRAEALAPLGPDPRIAAALVAALTQGVLAVGFASRGVDRAYTRLLDAIAFQRDPAQLGYLASVAARPRAKRAGVREVLRAMLPKFLAQIELPEIDEDDAAQWQPRQPNAAADLAALLAEVHQHPDEDDPRAVYADALIESGDPRGEFINLQLADTPTSRKQARRMLREHGEHWLDPDLAQVTKTVVYRRGFVEEITLAQNSAADPDVWARAKQSPQLATVRAVHRGSGNRRHHEDFVASLAEQAPDD